MNQFFVKNEQVARSLDAQAQAWEKNVYFCCSACSNPVAKQQGFLVQTSMTRSELQKQGILVSAPKSWGGA